MRHCERSEAIQLCARGKMDCFVASAPRNDGETALSVSLNFESGSYADQDVHDVALVSRLDLARREIGPQPKTGSRWASSF